MSNDQSTKKEVNGSCCAIQAFFQKAQEICNSDQVISSAEQLEELEQKVGDLTDQLQAISKVGDVVSLLVFDTFQFSPKSSKPKFMIRFEIMAGFIICVGFFVKAFWITFCARKGYAAFFQQHGPMWTFRFPINP